MTRKEILEAARQCVCGDREEDYGNPENNFARIAGLWSAYLGVPIRVWDVASMLALLKIGRIGGGQVKLDNWIDLAGTLPAVARSSPAARLQ